MRRLLTLLVATILLLSGSQLPAATGSWEYDLAVADRLLEHGYLDSALEDYQGIITSYPDQTPAVDRAWLGLGKCYDAQGDLSRAKACLEQTLERNADAQAVEAARNLYIQQKQSADAELGETQRALDYFQMRYDSTSWLDIFNKVFALVDLRKARKANEEKDGLVKSFNPRYLIPPVIPAGVVPVTDSSSFAPTADELASALDMVPESTVSEKAEEPVVTTADPVVTVTTTATGNEELGSKREAYLAAYRDLQSALASKNQMAIQQATTRFQEAVAAYNGARDAAAN